MPIENWIMVLDNGFVVHTILELHSKKKNNKKKVLQQLLKYQLK